MNHFCIFCSISLFFERKEKIESPKHEVNIFNGTVSKVVGLKFEGSSLLPFLWTRIVQAFFHSCRILPDLQTLHKILVNTVRRKGLELKSDLEDKDYQKLSSYV